MQPGEQRGLNSQEAERYREVESELADLSGQTLASDGARETIRGSVRNQLLKLYQRPMPSHCNGCGRSFANHLEVIRQTKLIQKPRPPSGSSVTTEHRQCSCGTTMAVISDDRRESTAFGTARRRLFQIYKEIAGRHTEASEDELQTMIASAFRQVMTEAESP